MRENPLRSCPAKHSSEHTKSTQRQSNDLCMLSSFRHQQVFRIHVYHTIERVVQLRRQVIDVQNLVSN